MPLATPMSGYVDAGSQNKNHTVKCVVFLLVNTVERPASSDLRVIWLGRCINVILCKRFYLFVSDDQTAYSEAKEHE